MTNSSSGPMPMICVGHASAAAPSARAKPSFIGRPAPKSARAEAQQMREISKHQTIISSRLLAQRQDDQEWLPRPHLRSEEHTSELQSLMRISYAVFCLKKKKTQEHTT